MFLFLIILIFGWLFYHMHWKRRNLPPGPLPIPILGNLHTLAAHEPGYGAFEMWRRQYGPIYTYWIGHFPFVVIADYPTIKETFVKDGESYQDRFTWGEITELYRGGTNLGVVESNGYVWKEHRRFAIHQLKEFGLGKNIMEQRVLNEVNALLDIVTEKCASGEEISIQEHIDCGVGSVINQLLFGYRFDETNMAEFLELKSLMSSQMKDFSSLAAFFVTAYPWLKYLAYFHRFYEKVFYYRDSFYGFFSRQIKEHEKQMDFSSQSSTDYVDAYLKEQKQREESGDYESFSTLQLTNLCMDLWTAGMETTSNTLAWSIVYLLNHPEVQMKLHEEFDRVIGSEREITMADKTNLPYLNAFVNEVQRLANLVPTNLYHQIAKPVELIGFRLEPGQGIIAQISTVLYDKDVFPEPYEFRPERFIDNDGKLKKVDELIPFSIGKRQCLGEGLARMELFLFTANIFNRFTLESVGGKPPKMDKSYGITMQPRPFKIYAKSKF